MVKRPLLNMPLLLCLALQLTACGRGSSYVVHGLRMSAPLATGTASTDASTPTPPQTPPAPPTAGPADPGAPKQDAEERQMLVLINRHRAENGAGPLRAHRKLVDSSRWLSQDMATRSYLSHTDSLGRDSFQRMDFFGYELNGWRGENIACGNGGAEETYLQWLYSPGHDENMLNPRYTRIGIARAYDAGSKYGWYWTTDFGSD